MFSHSTILICIALQPSLSLARSFKSPFKVSKIDGDNGVKFVGVSYYDQLGYSVSNAGDVNGDGYDDVILGAPYGDAGGSSSGESYVVFGGSDIAGHSGNFYLSDLDGSDGFRIDGDSSYDNSGYSVSGVGDVNGDGYDDVLVGAYAADGSYTYAGQTYVIFGGSTVGSSGSIDVDDLDGSNGFVINGDSYAEYSGISVSGAGDFNGDGYDDILIGASQGDPNGDTYGGESYLVYGGSNVSSTGTLWLSALTGSNGFVINGDDSYDYSGRSVSGAGDFNGDGYNDIIIGAYQADPDSTSAAGESYIVYGGLTVGISGSFELSALNGVNGFVIKGDDSSDYSGWAVSGAGDFNGDGYDDVIIGAYLADPNYDYSAGESYILYGGSSVGTSGSVALSSLDGDDGFVLEGIDSSDYSGYAVSNAGDVDGDGYDDVIIGAYQADKSNGWYFYGTSTGESYVVLGGSSVGSSGTFELDDLDGSNGFRIKGDDSYDYSGFAVGGGGDFNGDGYDDVIVGAHGGGNGGEAYIIFDTSTSSSSGSSGAVVGAIIGGIIGGICLIILMIWACIQCCASPKAPPPTQNQNIQLNSVVMAPATQAAVMAPTAAPPPAQYADNGYNGGFQLNNNAPAPTSEPVMVTATVVSPAPNGTKVADL
jgi:hypothetical protein